MYTRIYVTLIEIETNKMWLKESTHTPHTHTYTHTHPHTHTHKNKNSAINQIINVSSTEYCKYFSLINLFDITLSSSLLELKNKNNDRKCRNLLRKMSKWQLFLTARSPASVSPTATHDANQTIFWWLPFICWRSYTHYKIKIILARTYLAK